MAPSTNQYLGALYQRARSRSPFRPKQDSSRPSSPPRPKHQGPPLYMLVAYTHEGTSLIVWQLNGHYVPNRTTLPQSQRTCFEQTLRICRSPDGHYELSSLDGFQVVASSVVTFLATWNRGHGLEETHICGTLSYWYDGPESRYTCELAVPVKREAVFAYDLDLNTRDKLALSLLHALGAALHSDENHRVWICNTTKDRAPPVVVGVQAPPEDHLLQSQNLYFSAQDWSTNVWSLRIWLGSHPVPVVI